MTQILIRNLNSNTVKALKDHAYKQGRSLQSEVRSILEKTANTYKIAPSKIAAQVRQKITKRQSTDSTLLIAADRKR